MLYQFIEKFCDIIKEEEKDILHAQLYVLRNNTKETILSVA